LDNRQTKVLILDGELSVLRLLRPNFEQRGYRVLTAWDGPAALAVLAREKPDIVVLNTMVPALHSLDVCTSIRKATSSPIIVLSADGGAASKLLAFEAGADDYVTKPFGLEEFLARVKAQVRRNSWNQAESAILSTANVRLDESSCQVLINSCPAELAHREFQLLRYLMRHKGQVVSRQQVLDEVWGEAFEGGAETVNVHIHWLRKKIELNPRRPTMLVTVRTRGYILRDCPYYGNVAVKPVLNNP